MFRVAPFVRIALGAILVAGTLAAAEPLELAAPADGATLAGGSMATISWRATGALPHDAEEWEAFLSVDGGRSYTVRITPHLDLDVRSFAWRVPTVASDSVRLLIRMGNERDDEAVFELPVRLTIAATPATEIPAEEAAGSESRGESARPGDAPVVEWASGDRGGESVVVEHAPAGARVHAVARAHACAKTAEVASNGAVGDGGVGLLAARSKTRPAPARPTAPLHCANILRTSTRLNI